MILLIDDFPEPLLPMRRTFFFLGFLTSLLISLGITPRLEVDCSGSAILVLDIEPFNVYCLNEQL